MSRNNGVKTMTSAHLKFDDVLFVAEKYVPSWLQRLLQKRRETKRKTTIKRRLKLA